MNKIETLIQKLFKNSEKEFCAFKLGVWVVAFASAILSTISSPIWLIILCKAIIASGIGSIGSGVKDALDKHQNASSGVSDDK